ncbi:hypothetical protein LWI29_015679 [Acer saccharum]|uniref:glutathione transferase n=1 Tax=Acer saccharum TaxID=4024 RepID=A0AA39RUX7_ACESA|nr:hypothetical protein LWI29_015679 [Acer saccharum]
MLLLLRPASPASSFLNSKPLANYVTSLGRRANELHHLPFGLIPVLEDGDDLTLFGNYFQLISFILLSIPPLQSRNIVIVKLIETSYLYTPESRAITAYVAEKFKETGTDLIRHKDIKEAALVKVWIEVESQQYQPAISPIVYQYFVAPIQGKSPDQAIVDASVEKLGKVLDIYEAKLSESKYLAGDFYSLADLHHLPYTYYFMKTPCALS